MIIYDLTTSKPIKIKYKYIKNKVSTYNETKAIFIKTITIELKVFNHKLITEKKPTIMQYLFTADNIHFVKTFKSINVTKDEEGMGWLNVKY